MAMTLILTSLGGFAQQQDKARELMSRAEKQIYGYHSSEASFVSTYYDAKGAEIDKSSGKIYLQGENFRLEYGDITAVFSAKTLTHHNREDETLTISTPTSEELLQINPLYFLRSRGKGFRVQALAPKGGNEVLVYTPLGKSNVKQVSIAYNSKTALPSSVVVLSKDSSRMQIVLSAFRPIAKPLTQSFFTLSSKDFPKSEVVDLR